MSKENMEPIINQQPDATDDFINESTSSSPPPQKQTPSSILPTPPQDIATSVASKATSKRTSNESDDDTQHSNNTMKRSRVGNDDIGETVTATASSVLSNEVESEILDLARSMELKVGDRIEVQWEVDINGNNEEDIEEEEGEGKGLSEEPTAEDESTPSHVHWWGATLLEHDGRTDDHVAIRTLLYDPYPEGGFPESSREDVIFMGPNVLLSYPSQDELNYRILTADGSEVSYIISNDQDIEELVDTILSNALQNTSSSFQQLDRSQQIQVAEKIATKKEKLIQLIKEHMMDDGSHPNDISTTGNPRNRTVTAQDALTLLARAMQSE